jgi:hypothetical protein
VQSCCWSRCWAPRHCTPPPSFLRNSNHKQDAIEWYGDGWRFPSLRRHDLGGGHCGRAWRRSPDGITHARGNSVIGGSVVAPRGRGGERRGPHCITRAGSGSISGGLVGAPRGRGGERRAPHGITRARSGLVVDSSVGAPCCRGGERRAGPGGAKAAAAGRSDGLGREPEAACRGRGGWRDGRGIDWYR